MGLKEMTNIKPKVEALLKEVPDLRDDDNRLVANVWWSEIEDRENKSAKDLLSDFANGKLTSPESITRMRRKLQESNELYRGEKYAERHKEEVVVRHNIN